MNQFIFFANIGSDLAETGKKIATTFGLDAPHFIAQVISFSIVTFLLYKFAYGPILKMLAERRERIAQSQANAEKIRTELARTEQLQREALEKANIQANKLIEDARAAAARVQEQETQKAIAAAEQIISKAREAAAAEHARMLTELKREVGRLVVKTTTTVTGKILTTDDQNRMAGEAGEQIGCAG